MAGAFDSNFFHVLLLCFFLCSNAHLMCFVSIASNKMCYFIINMTVCPHASNCIYILLGYLMHVLNLNAGFINVT